MLSLTYEPGLSTLNKLDHKSNDIRPAGDNLMNKQWPRFGSKIYSATRFRTLLFVPRSSQFVSFEELRASNCELQSVSFENEKMEVIEFIIPQNIFRTA